MWTLFKGIFYLRPSTITTLAAALTFGLLLITFDPQVKGLNMHGYCISPQNTYYHDLFFQNQTYSPSPHATTLSTGICTDRYTGKSQHVTKYCYTLFLIIRYILRCGIPMNNIIPRIVLTELFLMISKKYRACKYMQNLCVLGMFQIWNHAHTYIVK
jgi:hypothetical protein